MKKFIKEKYADLLLQICAQYVNANPNATGRTAQAVARSMETMDKYSCYILGMGYMVDTQDIPYLKEYIQLLMNDKGLLEEGQLAEVYSYLSLIEREDVFET